MENMNTQIGVIHIESPDDEKILNLLKNFGENSIDGFLRLDNADRVFVVSGSEAQGKIQSFDGGALPMGEIEVEGVKYSEYSINESFFKS